MKVQLLLRVPDKTKIDAKKIAEHKGMTVNGYLNSEIRKLLDKELKHYGNT